MHIHEGAWTEDQHRTRAKADRIQALVIEVKGSEKVNIIILSSTWAPKSLWMVTAAMKWRHLLLGRKAMTNLDSILKSRHITLPTKVRLVKAMVFPVVMYGCESWTIKKAECQRIDAFELWCWRRLLRVLWTARRSNQSILKKTSPSWGRPVLGVHWKDWCWSWLSNTLANWCEELTHLQRPWCWERLKAGREGDNREDEMVGWHHRLNEHAFQ